MFIWEARDIYRSSDGGKSWNQAISNGTKDKWSHTGINVFGHTRDFLVDPKNPARFFIATADHGLTKSNTAGKDWQKVKSGLSEISHVWDLDACRAKKDSNYGKIVILAAKLNKTSCFAETDDGGLTWRRDCDLNDLLDRAIKVVVDQLDCKKMYIGASNGLFRTDNSGSSWSAVPFGHTHAAVRDIAIDKFSTVFVATSKGLFSVPADGKLVKEAVAFPGKDVTSVFVSKKLSGVIFAGVKKASLKGSALFRSKDGGWHLV